MTYFAAVIPRPGNIPNVTADESAFQSALGVAFGLAAGLAFIYTVVSAIRFSISAGDPQNVTNARRSLIYSVVGLVIALLALSIVSTINSIASDVARSGGDPITGSSGILAQLGEWLTLAVGVISAIMLIVGGLRYITSAGQPQSAQAARNTIVYAIVGLVVAGIANFIIGFVINRI